MITIIIPSYNEASRLVLDDFLSFVKQNSHIKLLFVDDGSTDATATLIGELSKKREKQISILTLKENRGKAEAVRQGVLHAIQNSGKFIGYWDADLSTPLQTVFDFLACFRENSELQLVCGARDKRMGTKINRHWYRHYPGRVVATAISIILRLPFYDTQCGAKLFTTKLAEHVFSTPFISKWFFDVELIARTIGFVGRKASEEIIYELPLNRWSDVPGSKVSFGDIVRIPFDLVHIYFYYRQQLRR